MAYTSLINRVRGNSNSLFNHYVNIAFKLTLFDYCAQCSIDRNEGNEDIIKSAERKQAHCQQALQSLQAIAESAEIDFEKVLEETASRFDKYIEKKEASN